MENYLNKWTHTNSLVLNYSMHCMNKTNLYSVFASDFGLQHVGDIKYACVSSYIVVRFWDGVPVLDRHVPASKPHHLPTVFHMEIIQACSSKILKKLLKFGNLILFNKYNENVLMYFLFILNDNTFSANIWVKRNSEHDRAVDSTA